MTSTYDDEYGTFFADDPNLPDAPPPVSARAHVTADTVGKVETKTLVLVPNDRRGQRIIDRHLNDGWSILSTASRALSRAVTMTFVRPKMTRAQRKGAGWRK